MKNLYFILFFTASLFSQTFQISGVIIDKNKAPLIGANAVVLNPKDSSIISGTTVNLKGEFEIKNIKTGRYILKISCIGFSENFKTIFVNNSDLKIDAIQLSEKVIKVGEVQINATIPPAVLEGDTTSYSSKAFKTNPDASSEDLVAKIPGVTVDAGKVQAQGEDVKRVLVDGKQFFGDDPTAILRNLPAEVVDKVQIFDERSEQSKFTGFDDGNTTKTMNIVTRPQFRNGTFGKISTMYGEDERYKFSSVLNYFNNNQRITFLAQSNNINEQNFSTEDLVGAVGGGGGGGNQNRMMSFRGGPGGGGGNQQRIYVSGGGGYGGGGGELGQFLVDQKNGLTKTNAIGLNFSDKYFDKHEINGSYFYNETNNNSISDLERFYLSETSISSFNYKENSSSNTENLNHRINLKAELKLDSMNSFLIQPRITFQSNNGNSDIDGINFKDTSKIGLTNNFLDTKLEAFNFSSPILYRHRFEKIGRTVSINFNTQLNYNDGTSIKNNLTNSFIPIPQIDTLFQNSNLDKTTSTIYSNLTFTESIIGNHSILFRIDNTLKNSFSDVKTNNFSYQNNSFSDLDSLQSNKFESTTKTYGLGVDYQFQNSDLTILGGISFQNANLENNQSFPKNYLINESFKSFLPNLMVTYKFSKESNLRFQYRASANIPSVDQLQEVLDNTKPLQLSVGNKNLMEDHSHFINLRFMKINPMENSTFFAFIGGNYSDNYVANSTFFSNSDSLINGKYFVPAGTRFYTPINLNGQYSLRAFTLYGFMLPFINANLNLSSFLNFSNTPSLINNQINNSKTPSLRLNLSVSSSISENLDYMLSSATTFSETKNSLQKEFDRKYSTQITRFRINVLPWEGLVFSSDVAYQYNKGLSDNYDKDFILFNASIGYKFLQNKRAEIKFTVNDILNQNAAITRNATDSYYEDVRSNVLQKYFVLSFSYNLRSFPQGQFMPGMMNR